MSIHQIAKMRRNVFTTYDPNLPSGKKFVAVHVQNEDPLYFLVEVSVWALPAGTHFAYLTGNKCHLVCFHATVHYSHSLMAIS